MHDSKDDKINALISALKHCKSVLRSRSDYKDEKIGSLISALRHCQSVFRSMSERGAYPQELLPFDMNDQMKESKIFLGVQGYIFIQQAIDKALKD